MAGTYYGAIHEDGLRVCEVKISKRETSMALFHGWATHKEIVPPSPLMGGHQGGQLEITLGIVEFLDGHVGEVNPGTIKFLDTEERYFKNKR